MKRGSGGAAAELLFEKWLWHEGHRWVHRFRKVMTGPVCKAHDGFGALDFLVLRKTGICTHAWGIQVTTQNGRSARRRKIERVPWPEGWRLTLCSHEQTPDPDHRGRNKNHWKLEDFVFSKEGRNWTPACAVEFDKSKTEESWRNR